MAGFRRSLVRRQVKEHTKEAQLTFASIWAAAQKKRVWHAAHQNFGGKIPHKIWKGMKNGQFWPTWGARV